MKSILSLLILFFVSSLCAQECEVLPPQKFRMSMNQMKSAQSDKELKVLIRPILERYCLETYQVTRMANLFRKDEPRLVFVQRAYEGVRDPENYYEVFDTFERFSSAFRLYDYMNYTDSNASPVADDEEPESIEEPEIIEEPDLSEEEVIVCTTSAEDYRSLIATLKKEVFPMRRLGLAESLISDRCLDVGQIGGFMDLLSIGGDRVEFAKSAYGNCVNPLEYHRLIDRLTFQSDKDDLLSFIRSRQ